MSETIHSFSFGGGVQSTAALVLAAKGLLPATEDSYRWDVFIFANVGEKAENPTTLEYVHEVSMPYARKHGIEIVEVRKKHGRNGPDDDLLDRILRSDRSLPFPVRMSNGAPGRRSCTAEFKIRPVAKELRRMGASAENPAIVGLGISVDEIQRAKGWGVPDPRNPEQIREYPLLRLGLRRRDALTVIADAGLPQPPRSACWFCPYHRVDDWHRIRRENPLLFQQAVELEQTLIERRAKLGKNPVYLTRFGRPISEVVHDQMTLGGEEMEACDGGSCFT